MYQHRYQHIKSLILGLESGRGLPGRERTSTILSGMPKVNNINSVALNFIVNVIVIKQDFPHFSWLISCLRHTNSWMVGEP